MIRSVALISLVAMLLLVLYVPSAHPPSRFIEQLRSEHEAAVAFWGAGPAYRILDRALRMQSDAAAVSPIPSARNMPHAQSANAAVSTAMASANQRLLGNAYFRSVDALLMLASYRLSALIEWLPWLLPLVLTASIDGSMVRVIRAKEFLQHDPEMFGLWCSLLIVSACGTVIALVIPVRLHPAAMGAVPITLAWLLGRAVASFHQRA